MKATYNFALFFVVIVVTGSVALGQEQGSAGVYNPSTETTVKGTIEQVKTAFLPGGGASAQAREESSGPTYLNLKTDSGTLAVFWAHPGFWNPRASNSRKAIKSR